MTPVIEISPAAQPPATTAPGASVPTTPILSQWRFRPASSFPYRHHASCVRSALPARTISSGPARMSEILSVLKSSCAQSTVTFSSSSSASHRSSIGIEDQRRQAWQIARSQPREGSNASRVPLGACSNSSFGSKVVTQTRQRLNTRTAGRTRVGSVRTNTTRRNYTGESLGGPRFLQPRIGFRSC